MPTTDALSDVAYDVAVIGGGIVGLATAWRLLESRPGLKLLLLEKEAELAAHQTGHNSGVIHSGIYYKPGSLRATNCRAGKQQLEDFCITHGIPFDRCGKVIVATSEAEVSGLHKIFERGKANGVECELISAKRLRELEPQVAGVAAVHVPETGIVDYRLVSKRLAELITEMGGTIQLETEFQSATAKGNQQELSTSRGTCHSRLIVTCGGLQSDRVALRCGFEPETKIVPFRGEYYKLRPRAEHLCRNLIYPVPDPNFPFLGVHLTRMIEGGVECGPNAVLAFAREGYHFGSFNAADLWETLRYPGFRKLGRKHFTAGMGELYRSLSKRAFVKALQRLVPDLRADDLLPAPAGVRAQAVTPDGNLADDFIIETTDRAVHVLNAPSPAATSSLNIGETISLRVLEKLPR
ncbi:L-2-hydroxyglutarate oxidase [Rubinisphaera margarita]|uniref:L-2-hydroxyglutarate oxidase n=1 Tax=Rubinisphaera margarita TaxID=2909586 RepID=UPI001EE8679B|nr:L-2-hydroxyglutarate oxidase [Rubinisphaera margarita]MCG6155610.1 L-2-hydroxyglutarate oxidase [Rubinisphaera margarita]